MMKLQGNEYVVDFIYFTLFVHKIVQRLIHYILYIDIAQNYIIVGYHALPNHHVYHF